MSFFDYLNMPKVFIVAIYEKLTEQANKTGITVKAYLHEEKNIEHISLVVYDILPLTIKFGLRYEKFHDKFAQYFKKIRDELFIYDDNQQNKKVEPEVQLEINEIDIPVAPVRKTRAKKTIEKTPVTIKKVTTKTPIKSKVTLNTAKKKIPNAKTIAAIEESRNKKNK